MRLSKEAHDELRNRVVFEPVEVNRHGTPIACYAAHHLHSCNLKAGHVDRGFLVHNCGKCDTQWEEGSGDQGTVTDASLCYMRKDVEGFQDVSL
jgi:hypothetical protein